MIVLDEQLLGRGIDVAIRVWYPGRVCFVTELRPNSVIKDDAIPMLLSQESQPTFVTINASDFWRRTPLSSAFCIVCFDIPDSSAGEVPPLLRELLSHSRFRSKAGRMGTAARVARTGTSYYTVGDSTVRYLGSE